MKRGYEIDGWTGHWMIFKDGQHVLNDKGQRFWFTKKVAAEKRVSELKKGNAK